MKNILTGPIRHLLCFATDPNDAPVDSTPADFSSLKGGGGGGDDIITIVQPTPKTPDVVTPIVPETPKTEPKTEPKVEPKKEATPKTEPTPKTELKTEPKTEPKVEPKKEASKTEPKVEPKKEEKPYTTPENDDDIEGIIARPNAPEPVKTAIQTLKEIARKERGISREFKQQVEALAKEKEELAKKTGELPAETKAEIEELREFKLMALVEADPSFRSEYEGKVTSTEDQLFSFLKSRGLTDEVEKEIKETGVLKWPGWGEFEKLLKAPLDRQEMLSLLMQRRDVDRDRDKRISEIKGNKEKFLATQAEASKQETTQWATKANAAVSKIGGLAKHSWAHIKPIPANATKEQREAIEAHNNNANELAKNISALLPKVYARDPDTVMAQLLEATRAGILDKQVETLQAEIEGKDARIAELEAKIAGVRKAGNITHQDSVAPVPAKVEAPTEGTGGEALAAFMQSKGK